MNLVIATMRSSKEAQRGHTLLRKCGTRLACTEHGSIKTDVSDVSVGERCYSGGGRPMGGRGQGETG